MKKLYIVRHAKSSWDDMSLRDFDRPLNDRGKRDAPKMGRRLKEREISPDLLISSPAVRALSTCREIAAVLGYKFDSIKTDKRIYHAGESTILDVLKETNNNFKSVMIFGHNPGFTEFANSLFDEQINNIPTCGVVGGKLAIESWADIYFGCGEMKFFDYPKRNLRK
ncbi:MAG: histidine phosphatase family protein [Flammeovirgaceae bacterium]|nr:histidine phosphatase family protein [Flammeovirgaceae bacterium]